MLGRPMPAPKPSARASAEAVEKPSRMAAVDVGDAGPAVDHVDVELAVARPWLRGGRPSAWMTTFISAS